LRSALLLGSLLLPGSLWAAGKTFRPTLKRHYDKDSKSSGAGALVKTAAGSQHLDDTHYTSIRDGALAMMQRYPPGQNWYLSLGRSAVSMFTFLKALDPNITATFPASDLRFGINANTEPEFFKHFEKYIPADVLKGERGSIVIFDRSHDRSGGS